MAQTVKKLPALWETWVRSLGGEDPLEKWVAVFFPEEFHGQRSLASYRPWGCKESDTTERLTEPASESAESCHWPARDFPEGILL